LPEAPRFQAYLSKPVQPSALLDALLGAFASQARDAIQSREETGTTTRAAQHIDAQMAARHPLRILLAEDNLVNQKLALHLLGQMGYRPDLAANGIEVLRALERQTYDVILMDVQMPEMDGLEASRQVCARWSGNRRPHIIAMTAHAMQGDREECLRAGMNDYVSKPIRVPDLVEALNRVQALKPEGDT